MTTLQHSAPVPQPRQLYAPKSPEIKRAGAVYMTRDLSQFSRSALNRDISDHHLAKLKAAIQSKNLLEDFPILVTKEMVIIDGQHRHQAAVDLGLPIWYRIATATGWGDLGTANDAVRKWSDADYLQFWCEKGEPDYLRLREFLRAHLNMMLKVTYPLMAGKAARGGGGGGHSTAPSGTVATRDFRSGTWRITTFDNAVRFAAILDDYARYYSRTHMLGFVSAVDAIIGDPRYDHRRMMYQLEHYGKAVEIKNATRRDDYLLMLEYAYNFNRRANRVEGLGQYTPSIG